MDYSLYDKRPHKSEIYAMKTKTNILPKAFLKLTAIASVSLFAGLSTAYAQAPKLVGKYKDWSVYSHDLQGDVVCFALAKPKTKSPKSVNHGDVFFMVANWKSGVAKNQPSLMAGYDLSAKPEPVVRVGSDKWSMFVSEAEGFIEQTSDELQLVNSMKRGAEMRVSAVSKRGTSTNYTFSLQGITAALKSADKACN